MQFYDILEQTPYKIMIAKPENMEDLSDLFVTEEELEEMVGRNVMVYGKTQTIKLNNTITREVIAWAEKLVASGKKTLRIEDEALVDVLKEGHLRDYTEDDTRFGRHGDRICYAQQFKRKKTKVTGGDVKKMWDMFTYAFREKFNVYPTHIPRYERGVNMFKAYKSIIGWQLMRKQMHNKDLVKFYRQIWDNPEGHIK